jgi:hypothetical protein
VGLGGAGEERQVPAAVKPSIVCGGGGAGRARIFWWGTAAAFALAAGEIIRTEAVNYRKTGPYSPYLEAVKVL